MKQIDDDESLKLPEFVADLHQPLSQSGPLNNFSGKGCQGIRMLLQPSVILMPTSIASLPSAETSAVGLLMLTLVLLAIPLKFMHHAGSGLTV